MAVTLAPVPVASGRKNMRRGQEHPLEPGPKRAAKRNPRALGTNPRAKGTNPRAFAADGTKARAAQTNHEKSQAARKATNRAWLARHGRGALVALHEAHSAPQPHPTVIVDGTPMELAPAGGLTLAQSAARARSIRQAMALGEQLGEEEGGEPP